MDRGLGRCREELSFAMEVPSVNFVRPKSNRCKLKQTNSAQWNQSEATLNTNNGTKCTCCDRNNHTVASCYFRDKSCSICQRKRHLPFIQFKNP